MPRGRQTAQKASTLAFAEVLARGRIPRICFLDLQLQGRPRLDDLSRQLRGKIRARGGVSQKPRAPEQPRVTTIDCLQLVLRDSLRNQDRKSTRLNSSHGYISYAVFCLKKKKNTRIDIIYL